MNKVRTWKKNRIINGNNEQATCFRGADNTGQQNLAFFLAHEEKYLILIELLTLNSNV